MDACFTTKRFIEDASALWRMFSGFIRTYMNGLRIEFEFNRLFPSSRILFTTGSSALSHISQLYLFTESYHLFKSWRLF